MTTSLFGPVMMGSALPALRRGLALLESTGWTQHIYATNGGYCSLGVLDRHGHGSGAEASVLARAIRDSGWTPNRSNYLDGDPFSEWGAPTVIARWNDEDGRTWEQVRSIWESAINIAQTFAPTPTPNVTPTK